MNEQILIGGVTALLCGLGLWRDRWLLEHSRNGRRLTEWLGPAKACRVLRISLAAGFLFGTLLACGVIRPVIW